ncbi:hypothetical protein ASD38_16605 [Caulobacter sp. Root487D2Y]|nr:hypothetical protein ASD38_16605 [Caulobacter sp. Root487D2Y]
MVSAARQSGADAETSDNLAVGFLNFWRHLLKEQRQDEVLNDREGAAAACIPWARVTRVPAGQIYFIDHWWHESEQAPANNRKLVLQRCEEWRQANTSTCACHLISDHMRPVLEVPPAERTRIQTSTKPIVEVSSTVADAWLAEERSVQILRSLPALRAKHGMQSSAFSFGIGNTASLAPSGPVDRLPKLVVQQGHNENIFAARWSSSSRFVASGGMDNRVLIWRADDLRLLRDLHGHVGIVRALAFSQDDQKLASGGEDGLVIVWEVATGRRLATLTGHGSASGLVFRADGQLVAHYGDGSVLRWTAKPGSADGEWSSTELLRPGARGSLILDWRDAYEGEAGRFRFNDEGVKPRSQVLPPENPPRIRVYDPETETVRELAAAWSGISGVAGPRRGQLVGSKSAVLVGSALIYPDGDAFQVSTDDGATVSRRLSVGKGTADGLAFSPSGTLLAAVGDEQFASDDGRRVKIWNLDKGGAPIEADGRSVFGFSPDSRYLLGAFDGSKRLRVWDAATGRTLRDSPAGNEKLSAVTTSGDGRRLILAQGNGDIQVWDLTTGRREEVLHGHPGTIGNVALDPSGRFLVAGGHSQRFVSVWDLQTGTLLWAIVPTETPRSLGGPGIDAVAFTRDGLTVAYAVREKDIVRVFLRRTSDGQVLSARRGPLIFAPTGESVVTEDLLVSASRATAKFPLSASDVEAQPFLRLRLAPPAGRPYDLHAPTTGVQAIEAAAFSPDGRYLAVLRTATPADHNDLRLTWLTEWDTRTGLIRVDGRATGVLAIAVAQDGSVFGGHDDGRVLAWRPPSLEDPIRDWQQEELARSSSSIRGLAVTPHGDVIAAGDDGLARIWPAGSDRRQLTLGSRNTGEWVVVAEDGRFDASTPDTLGGFQWLMPDDPYRPLSPSLFMRDYFQPQLLPLALGCGGVDTGTGCRLEPRDPTAFAKLNRVQPRVAIRAVRPGPAPGTAIVTVSADPGRDDSQPNGKTQTAPYDLRLFRNGQLVQRWATASYPGPPATDRDAWRTAMAVPGGSRDFTVQVPSDARAGPVQFTAYAFNEDRVKSDTTPPALFSSRIAPRQDKRRAYVIAIGVNEYANGLRPLSFAAKDARDIANALRGIIDYDVAPVTLVSDADGSTATKAQIRAVFAVLGGNEAARAQLRGVAGAEQLKRATPDDVVIVEFSGHGHIEADGRFYLLPSDSEPGVVVTEPVRAKYISAAELAEWLEPVDAGEMSVIIDACYAAGSVASQGFRPGPLGDPGLGQLTYDKRMRVLAASQADEGAREVGRLQQGLLTYALVRRGLEKREADLDSDGRLTLAEWLRFGEVRAPEIFASLAGSSSAEAGGFRDSVDLPGTGAKARPLQRPALFDFGGIAQDVMLLPPRRR